MSLRLTTPRAGRRPDDRLSRRLVVVLLMAVTAGLLGVHSAAASSPAQPGPVGLPEIPSAPVPMVVGGSAVPDGGYPFQAALLIQSGGTNDAQRQYCGGSLIAPSRVLTAAHCVQSFVLGPELLPLSELRVVVGRTVLTAGSGQRRSASQVTIHPQWDPSTYRYDVAVITLSQPVFGIRPVRVVLPGVGALERSGRSATATGWGNTLAQTGFEDGGSLYPDRMRQVRVPFVAPQQCDRALTFDGVAFLDQDTMLCAGRTGRDSCQGDSGGPLFTNVTGVGYVQIGITSWGIGCAAAGYPGVYTKLSSWDIGSFVLRAAGWLPAGRS